MSGLRVTFTASYRIDEETLIAHEIDTADPDTAALEQCLQDELGSSGIVVETADEWTTR